MGEYAIRKSDGVEVKIGTCEEMYYLRYEDREKVRVKPNNVDPVQFANELRFRLPFPDEDHILPGDYDNHKRGERLYIPSSVSGCSEAFSDDSTVNEPGRIQLRHECGLILGIPCYHGIKLPEVVHPMAVFWNGKSWFFELMQLRPTRKASSPW